MIGMDYDYRLLIDILITLFTVCSEKIAGKNHDRKNHLRFMSKAYALNLSSDKLSLVCFSRFFVLL